MSRSNRALLRTGLVAGGEPPRCPTCGGPLTFGTDRQGRALQSCDCGYSEYVPLRSGSIPTQGPSMARLIEPPPSLTPRQLAPTPKAGPKRRA